MKTSIGSKAKIRLISLILAVVAIAFLSTALRAATRVEQVRTPTPFLLHDLNRAAASSMPSGFSLIGNELYFTADDGIHGAELWKSDGTTAGTALLKDINAGSADSIPTDFVGRSGQVFFRTSNGTTPELWATDGTRTGTVFLRSFPEAYSLSEITVVGDRAFFLTVAADTYVASLWRTDGTSAGTVLVREFPREYRTALLTSFNGSLYFYTGEFSINDGLWTSDGTAAGTLMVKQVSGINEMIAAGDKLYFSSGQGLWKSDGSTAGTVRVAELGHPFDLTYAQGFVYFSVFGYPRQELWKSDGTPAGTVQLEGASFKPHEFAWFNNSLILAGYNDEVCGLWKSDLTPDSLQLIQPCTGIYPPRWLTNASGTLFFSDPDSTGRDALWRTDGTPSGTILLQSFSTYPWDLINAGQLVFVGGDPRHGLELWASDGSPAGTRLLKDLNQATLSSDPVLATSSRGTLFMVGEPDSIPYQGDAPSWWASESIWPARLTPLGAVRGQLVGIDEQVFAITSQSIWKSEGTSAGTQQVFSPSAGNIEPEYTSFAGELYFIHRTHSKSYPCGPDMLMKTNGAETSSVKESGACGSIGLLTSGASGLSFVMNSNQLWRSDGSSGGTVLVTTLTGATIEGLINTGNAIYFLAENNQGFTLWRSDGTAAGTAQVKAFGTRFHDQLIGTDDRLYLLQCPDYQSHSCSLWTSDGSEAGTVLLRQFSRASDPVLGGTQLFFAADDGQAGMELWTSDGSEAGTRMVADIQPGPGSSSPADLTYRFGMVVFSADNGTHGAELWQSDGTAGGTRLVADLEPGAFSSSPGGFVYLNSELFFAATVYPYGREVWGLSSRARPAVYVPQIRQ